MGNSSTKDATNAETVTSIYTSASRMLRERAVDSSISSGNSQSLDPYELSNAYKQGSPSRIAAKAGLGGAIGLCTGLVAIPGPPISAAAAGALNAAAVLGFYDLIREALTSLTVTDSLLNTCVAGMVTGYVWNGLVHQSRANALSGALLVATASVAAHAAWPSFEADKVVISTLVDMGSVEDRDGRLRSWARSPPLLEPVKLADTWAALGRGAAQVLPVKQVSEEEYEHLQGFNPPMTVVLRRYEGPEASGNHGDDPKGTSSDSSNSKHL